MKMSRQATHVSSKQQNRDRLYASYSEGVNDNVITAAMKPRDVYIYRGLDKDLLVQRPSTRGFAGTRSKSNLTGELLQRYKQSMKPSDPAYHSMVTMDEALNPPWALHYNIKRQPASPNFLSTSTNMPARREPPRRLQSAPLVRSPSPVEALNIPEPRLGVLPNPVTTTTTTTHSIPLRARASSALGYYDTSDSSDRKQRHHGIKSAELSSLQDALKLTNDKILEVDEDQIEQPVQIIFTKSESSIPPPPIYVYKKSATWCPDETSIAELSKSTDANATPVNPHYIYRPAVIAAENFEKKTLEKVTTPSKKTNRHRHIHDKRNVPLIALTPMPQKTRLSVETDGVKLTYDPKLTLEDKSPNLNKYFIDGRLYLIKDHRYNVLNNVDPSIIQKYNQNSTTLSRPKYYQTIPVDKYQLPKPSFEIHYNAPDTFFYNTIPKRSHRYVINPNFISENLNVNRVSLGQRPPTTTIYA